MVASEPVKPSHLSWTKAQQHARCSVACAIASGVAANVPESVKPTLLGKMARDLRPLVDRVTPCLRNPNITKAAWTRISRTLGKASKLMAWDTEWPPEEQSAVWALQVQVAELLWMNAVNCCPLWTGRPASAAIAAGVAKAIFRSLTDRIYAERGDASAEDAWEIFLELEKMLGRKL